MTSKYVPPTNATSNGTRLAEADHVSSMSEIAKGAQVFTLACKSVSRYGKRSVFLAMPGRFVDIDSAVLAALTRA